MNIRYLLTGLILSATSSAWAVQTCGSVASMVSVCNNNQCAPHLFNDREELTVSGGWTMTNTATTIGSTWNFSTKFDGISKYTITNGQPSQVSFPAPAMPLGKVAAGQHNASAILDPKGCTETITVNVEATKIIGAVESVSPDALITGGACIRGATSNKLIPNTAVTIYADDSTGTLKSLGSVQANGANVSTSVGGQCGPDTAFSLQLSERQQADFCNRPVWAGVTSADGASVNYLPGSQNYLIPCAMRPFIDKIEPGYYVTGSNFKIGTKVDIYDSGNMWQQGASVTYIDEKHIRFSLPGTPPSQCNLKDSCTIGLAFYNPEGITAGKWTYVNVTLPSVSSQYLAKVTQIQVVTTYSPWAVGIRGSGFQKDASIDIYDTNGSFWSTAIGYAFADSGFISFQLPTNVPPSGCNLRGNCTITAKINNPFSYNGGTQYATTTISITLPKVASPSINYVELNKSFSPWAVGLKGSNFTPASHVAVYDYDGSLWSGNTNNMAFGNTGFITFQLPNNVPPSRCNIGKSCTIKFRVINEFGGYAENKVTLPKQ